MHKLFLVLALLLAGCKTSSEDKTSSVPPSPVKSFVIEKTPALIQELKAQPTIDDQFGILYENFGHLLDRSESLAGPDKNNDGIRDDIEAFIDALEVIEPVRNVIKQNARYQQENMNYDFTIKNSESMDKAYEIADKAVKVIACERYLGIKIDDSINISSTIEALTHNTKNRTIAYIDYNHLLNGFTVTLLPEEEKFCE